MLRATRNGSLAVASQMPQRRELAGFGLEPGRVRLVWASAAEGARFAAEVSSFVTEIKALGPLHWGKSDEASAPLAPSAQTQPELQEVPA